jgi:hypothetical protein
MFESVLETDIPAVFLAGRGRSTERKSSQSQWKELSHSRELIFERKKEKKGGRRSSSRRSVLVAESKTKLSIQHRS